MNKTLVLNVEQRIKFQKFIWHKSSSILTNMKVIEFKKFFKSLYILMLTLE
jgi:hypothetical protein